VKIDRSFVAQLADSDNDRRIVQGIVALVGGCGMTAVAEGIETWAQAHALVAAGCALGQGYAIAPPVPEAQWLDWLRQPPRPLPRPDAAAPARAS
jgi:EAL domain-containing protein (putative c-di-GMP-specific phosphodiesterase class I)